MIDFERLADRVRQVTVEVKNDRHSTGAGVVITPELVVTNAHVIQRSRVLVRLPDGRRAHAVVIGRNRDADLAVLRVPDLGLPVAMSAESDTPRVGSLVIAIGHPFGMQGAVSTGIVHAVGPISRGGRSWIQADLRLAPGYSGGPLADAEGRLLGLNAMIIGGLAMAIPVSEVRRFARATGVSVA